MRAFRAGAAGAIGGDGRAAAVSFLWPWSAEDPRRGSAWRSRSGAVGPSCAAASTRARGPWNKWGDPHSGGRPFMPRKPLARISRRRGAGSRADSGRPALPSPDDRAEGPASPVRGAQGRRTATRRVDAARRPPQGSRGRPRLIHSQRAALPVAVGDSSTYPQASGKLCGQGWAGLPIAGRPCLVHGARPKAGCVGRFRPPGAARTVGKRWANCSPGVGAAGAGSWRSRMLASGSWPPIRASGARRPHAAGGVRGPQGRGWKPEGARHAQRGSMRSTTARPGAKRRGTPSRSSPYASFPFRAC